MQRDYSPTYYFRIRRAEQLLALYRNSPKDFEALSATYKSDFVPSSLRAPHRLSVWLRRDDLVFHSRDDIRTDTGKRLVHALDQPAYFGYSLSLTPDFPRYRSPLAGLAGGVGNADVYRVRNPAHA